MTNISDSHQDVHRAGIKTKGETNIGDSLHGKNKDEAMTNLGDSLQDGHGAGVKAKAVTIIGDAHQDVHRAGVKTKAKTNINDSLHGKNKNKAVTNLGDSHQDGHRASVKTKAMTNIGDSHQDGHRAGAKTNAVTNISDSLHDKNKNEAVTNLGDSHQDGHRAGVRTKAVTNSQHLQQYLTDERVEARSQTLMEQAKNKTTVNPKYNGKAREWGWTARCKARERGWTVWCRVWERGWTVRCRAGERGWTIGCRTGNSFQTRTRTATPHQEMEQGKGVPADLHSTSGGNHKQRRTLDNKMTKAEPGKVGRHRNRCRTTASQRSTCRGGQGQATTLPATPSLARGWKRRRRSAKRSTPARTPRWSK